MNLLSKIQFTQFHIMETANVFVMPLKPVSAITLILLIPFRKSRFFKFFLQNEQSKVRNCIEGQLFFFLPVD